MATILDKIVASKRREIEEARNRLPIRELETQLASAPALRDFRAALQRPAGIQIIAEVKKASPSAGVLRADFDPVALARIYENVAARFHLGDWHKTIDSKLKTLDDLYQLLNHDQTNRWMLLLEMTIVLLFVIDLVLLFLGMKHP